MIKPLFYSIFNDISGKPLGCLGLQKPNHKINAIQRTRAQGFPNVSTLSLPQGPFPAVFLFRE